MHEIHQEDIELLADAGNSTDKPTVPAILALNSRCKLTYRATSIKRYGNASTWVLSPCQSAHQDMTQR